jgi:DNA-binding NarL/FixJ family response regulator
VSMPVKIAIVDDHTMMVQAIASMISQHPGFEVILTARNGKAFIDELTGRDELPDLMLLDINMPVMGGVETASWIQKNFPAVRILCLTMNDDELSIIRMFRSGAKGYLLKDADEDELLFAIECVMTKGFYYSDFVARVMLDTFKTESRQAPPEVVASIRDREIEFLELCCSDLSYKQIADEMHLSPKTIDGYREALFAKTGTKSRVGLVLYAIRHGIVKI